jgi:ATP-binding cassette subfamily F protein uup
MAAMALPPVLALRDVFITFGGAPLFTGVTAGVAKGEKVCLVGRNGSGKSTLLRVLAGQVEQDSGERFVQPGLRIAYLPQDPPRLGASVRDYVATGLPEAERDQLYRVDTVLAAVGVDGGMDPMVLSGGEWRRAALACALVGEPDALLLDEPTNHLDLPTILWLEEQLAAYAGALVVISHDRRFLETVSRQTWWLENGTVRRNEKGFSDFPRWQEEVYAAEELELARMDKRLASESAWASRGVKARVKRNMGRVRALMELRSERAARPAGARQVQLGIDSGDLSGKLVVEAEAIAKSYDGRAVVKDFSTRILRGDRVGILGPNGAGKTTLLKMLIGELAPDSGLVRIGTNLQPATFDQRREQLDPETSVKDTLTDGRGDNVWVHGKPRHVMGYLRDFLFDDRQAVTPVRALSGGERNRLLLAKILAKPSNLLILDEPTNDLDMDTLDLLEEVLSEYEGTLLLVSHDRDFLDRLVTSTIAVEGDGRIEEYPGGYSDYLRQRKAASAEPAKAKPAATAAREAPRSKPAAKLSYNEQRDLERLPALMDKLHGDLARLEAKLADPGLYTRDPAAFQKATAELETARDHLAAAEERWLELELKREELGR